MLHDKRVGILGGGKMGTALAHGLLAKKLVPAAQVTVCELDEDRQVVIANDLKVVVHADCQALVREADVIIVALKPNIVRRVLPELAEAMTDDKLIVSIAAGVTLAELGELLGAGRRLVRVMPNTPCQVGSGASAFALGGSASAADGDLVNLMLVGVGISFGPVPEPWLDAVTGLSGSGPAFAALVIEALADGGVLCGLPRDMATTLAAQTVLGAARLVLETDTHPAQLKDMVSSPGGTTIEGVQALEDQGLRAALIRAVEVATLKSRALGQK